jgi:hypothetical protein
MRWQELVTNVTVAGIRKRNRGATLRDYNALQAMTRLRHRFLGLTLLLTIAATCAQAAGRFDDSVAELAQKLSALAGPGTATLELHNASSLAEDQVAAIGLALERQLRSAGVQLRPAHDGATDIRVTFSENQRGWLWIAEIRQGTENRVAMIELPGARATSSPANSALLALRSSLLLSTREPLLDLQPLRPPQAAMAALMPGSVVLYEQQSGRWKPSRTLPMSANPPLPRDPRGKIVPGADHPFDVYLPGQTCTASAGAEAAITLDCHASDDPWPLGTQRAFYNSARNYFTGLLGPALEQRGLGRRVPAFYSAAALPRAKYTLWLFAGVDGRVRALDGVNELQLGAAARNWGADIAAIQTACGSGMQVLAAESGTDVTSDSLQAFEIADREPSAASAPLRFNGSITALWPTAENAAATAIIHTPQGGYDAYSITLACNQ